MSSPILITPSTQQQQQRPLGFSAPQPSSPLRPRANKKMSIAQTYFLAHKARAKLSSEAARPDHNLRLLVGHANLLDSLMLELADAEREQESWFNQSVRGASSSPAEKRHIQWADSIAEEESAEDSYSSDSDSDSDSESYSDFDEEEEDVEMADAVSLRRIPSHTMLPHKAAYPTHDDYDMEEDDEDEDEDYEQLALQRSPSHSVSSSSLSSPPPELDDDSDSTEDESMPPSPPTTLIPAFEAPQQQQKKESNTTPEDKAAFYEEGYYLPPRNPARLITAISVY